MTQSPAFFKQIELIDRMMNSICEMAELRQQELKSPELRQMALEKIDQSFQMIEDLCVVTRLLIKEVRKETALEQAHGAIAQ